MKNKLISKILELRSHINLERLTRLRFALITFFSVGVFTDVFYLKVSYDIFLLALILMWILIIKLYAFKSDATFKAILICLLPLSILFIAVPGHNSLERLTVWIYLLLIVGIFQQWREATR